MNARVFHFVSHWKLRACADDVYAALTRFEALPDWWPGIDSARADPSRPDRAWITLHGLLPLALRIDIDITDTHPPTDIRFNSHGDLVGTGHWNLRASGPFTHATLTWNVHLQHPLLARLPDFTRPGLIASHHFLMWRGKRALNRTLQRELV